MKKIVLTILSLMLLFVTVNDKTYAGVMKYYKIYSLAFDYYKVNYEYPQTARSVEVVFNFNDIEYRKTFTNLTPLYLTCRGSYDFLFYDSSGALVGTYYNITTNKIKKNVCWSYDDAMITNLNPQFNRDSNNNTSITFDNPNGNNADIYLDEQLIGSTNGGVYNSIINNPSGNISIKLTDGNSNLIGQDTFDFDSGGKKNTSDDDGAGESSDNGSDSNDNECADIICACIAELKSIMLQNNSLVEETNDILKQSNLNLNEIINRLDISNSKLTNIDNDLDITNSLLDSINNHLSTDTIPEINIPTIDNTHNEIIDIPYQEDNTVYFSDTGEIEAPPLMPSVPNPSYDWTDGENTYSPQAPLTPDKPLERDEPLTPDAVLERDEPLIPDAPLEPDKTEYPLRWKSSEYKVR